MTTAGLRYLQTDFLQNSNYILLQFILFIYLFLAFNGAEKSPDITGHIHKML